MAFELGGETALTDRLETVPNWAALAAVLVAVFVSIHGVGHVLLAPAGHLQVSMQSVLLVLWVLTTVVAFSGLAVLGGAYTSVVRTLKTGSHVDLEILPDDERYMLEPILETPGITQVEVVARSDYSDAKVSQTLKALRERGLIYREPQGRTYRLYPGTLLSEPLSESE